MQRYSFRHVSRAVFAGLLIAGLAAGAGCQKKGDNGAASSDSGGAASGMSAAPSTAPSGTPSSGAAGMSPPGAASAPAGASGG